MASILVIEDDAANRKLLRLGLEEAQADAIPGVSFCRSPAASIAAAADVHRLFHLAIGWLCHEGGPGEDRMLGHRSLQRLQHRQGGYLPGGAQSGVLFLDEGEECRLILFANTQ